MKKENIIEEKDTNYCFQCVTSSTIHFITCGIPSVKQGVEVPNLCIRKTTSYG